MAALRLAAAPALLLVALAGCSDGGGGDHEGHTEVAIHNFQFDPAQATVEHGVVVFVNHDSVPHTATADGGAFDTGNLDQDEEYEVELPSGTYAYHCKLHAQMRGTLTVP